MTIQEVVQIIEASGIWGILSFSERVECIEYAVNAINRNSNITVVMDCTIAGLITMN